MKEKKTWHIIKTLPDNRLVFTNWSLFDNNSDTYYFRVSNFINTLIFYFFNFIFGYYVYGWRLLHVWLVLH